MVHKRSPRGLWLSSGEVLRTVFWEKVMIILSRTGMKEGKGHGWETIAFIKSEQYRGNIRGDSNIQGALLCCVTSFHLCPPAPPSATWVHPRSRATGWGGKSCSSGCMKLEGASWVGLRLLCWGGGAAPGKESFILLVDWHWRYSAKHPMRWKAGRAQRLQGQAWEQGPAGSFTSSTADGR